MSFGHKSLFCAERIGYVLSTGEYCCYFRISVVASLVCQPYSFSFIVFDCLMGLLLFALALRGNIKLFKTVADNIVYRGRTNFVASECFHQTSAFQFGQCLTGSLSLRYGRGVSVYDRQGFLHPCKVNSSVVCLLFSVRHCHFDLFLFSCRCPIRFIPEGNIVDFRKSSRISGVLVSVFHGKCRTLFPRRIDFRITAYLWLRVAYLKATFTDDFSLGNLFCEIFPFGFSSCHSLSPFVSKE
ncbi:hypothetical protein HMPREF1254_1241 [Prevotella sp. BV3P1]|nr:hypothetical protein HMPREF1254_1241 [Prevotella sp. BV3P1]